MASEDTRPYDSLRLGDTFYRGAVAVTVLGAPEPAGDSFGQPMTRIWCQRADTGAYGWVMYGAGGTASATPEVSL